MHIENLFNFEQEGWAILADIKDVGGVNESIAQYTFIPIQGGKEFKVSRSGLKLAQKMTPCFCKFTEHEDLRTLESGDDVFIWIRNRISYATFNCWHRGKIRVSVYSDTTFTRLVHPYSVLAYSHSFQKIPDTTAKYCKRCEALNTDERLHPS